MSTSIAIFYFMAQVIERVLELINWVFSFFTQPANEQDKERIKGVKMITMWVLACVLGYLTALCLDLNLMARMDIKNVAPWLDKIFTALVLGSGTKPIHDIITIIERKR